jgi:hypothetical protein
MKDALFFNKVYNLEGTLDDWSLLMPAGPRDPGNPPESNCNRISTEYLKTIIKPDCYYSVPLTRSSLGGDGEMVTETERSYFMILQQFGGSSKPKVVPTMYIPNENNDAMNANSSVSVQYLLVWRPISDTHVTVTIESDPTIVSILDLGPWPSLYANLLEWDFAPSSDANCFDLVTPRRAVPTMALTDSDCPVLCLLAELRRRGFKALPKLATHKCIADMKFDGRNAVSKRKYFLVLLSLADSLLQNDTVVSNQPQSYYELVLRRQHVEVGLGNDHYKRQLEALANGAPMVALPPPGHAALADASSGDDWGVAGVGDKPPPKRRRLADDDDDDDGDGPLALPDAPSRRSPSSDNADTSGSSGFGVGGRSSISEWVQVPNGPRFKLDQYKAKKKNLYMRWVAECPHHASCEKKRSVNASVALGDVEHIAYLCAWAAAGLHLTKSQHTERKLKVSREAVIDWSKKLEGHCGPVLDLLKS